MAFLGVQVTVTTAATLVVTGAAQKGAQIVNRGTASVFLGSSAVTTAGFEVAAGEAFSIDDMGTGDDLYAICASGTVRVDVLRAV